MNYIENTRKNPHPEWLKGQNPTAIETQEEIGQKQLVESEVLPTKGDKKTKETLEAMGVVFKEPVKDDPLFTNVLLPKGWKKVKTDHSMWSDLVNETGKKIASIFYKAAFYDRDAFMYLENSIGHLNTQ